MIPRVDKKIKLILRNLEEILIASTCIFPIFFSNKILTFNFESFEQDFRSEKKIRRNKSKI